MFKNEMLEKYAHNMEDRLVLARVLDKMSEAGRKNIVTSTGFLNENQRALAELLIKEQGNPPHSFYGGYSDAERRVAMFFPDDAEPEEMPDDRTNPLAGIRVTYSGRNAPSHRDFLGALMGCGIKRETVGDILVSEGSCDIIVLKEVLPYLTSNLTSAGRTKLANTVISTRELIIPEQEYKLVKDTVASLRLDNVVASGFSISRGKAAEAVNAGKVYLNHLECTKADKPVSEGDVISVRGMGKFELQQVGHTTKKGRVAISIKRYC